MNNLPESRPEVAELSWPEKKEKLHRTPPKQQQQPNTAAANREPGSSCKRRADNEDDRVRQGWWWSREVGWSCQPKRWCWELRKEMEMVRWCCRLHRSKKGRDNEAVKRWRWWSSKVGWSTTVRVDARRVAAERNRRWWSCWRRSRSKKQQGQRQMVSHLSMKMVRLPWEETGEGAASYWNQLRRHQWWWYWFAWERQGAGIKVAIKKGQGRRDDFAVTTEDDCERSWWWLGA